MMKSSRFMLSVLLLFITLNAAAETNSPRTNKQGAVHTDVRGYSTKKGKVVKSHARTKKDKSKNNNYTSKGMVNPSTGKKGTRVPK